MHSIRIDINAAQYAANQPETGADYVESTSGKGGEPDIIV